MNNKAVDFQIFKISPFEGLIVLTDYPKFTIVAATDKFLMTYKKIELDIIDKGFFEIFNDLSLHNSISELTDLPSYFFSILENGKTGNFEQIYLKSKKEVNYTIEEKFYSIDIIPIDDKNKLPKTFIISIKEIDADLVPNELERKNNQYYRSIVENSLSAFFLTKPDGTILDANKAACDLFGYTLEELKRIGRQQIIDHSDVKVQEKLKERNETGRIKAELIGIKKSGEKFPIEVSSLVFLDLNGEQRTSTTINDITERKNIESALQTSEKYLLEAQKLAKIGSWNFIPKEDKLTWTEGLYAVFGADKETFFETYDSFLNLVTEEDKPFVLETSQNILKTGESFNIEYRITTPNGNSKIIEEFGYSEKDDNGEVIRVFGTAQDITERKNVEKTLILSERKYKTLFEDNPMPMFIWDFETLDIIDCNEEALIKYGYTRQEFLKLNIVDIRPKEDIYLINEATKDVPIYGAIHKKTWRHLKKNGDLMMMEVTGHLIINNGKMASLVLCNDFT